MPRPDSLPRATHYRISDRRFATSTASVRIAPDALALQVWGDAWDDATTPRTDRPARFNAGYRLYAFAAPLGRTFAPSFTYRQRGN